MVLSSGEVKMIVAVLLAFIIPVTLTFWILEIFFYSSYRAQGGWEPISPWRWLLTICLPLAMTYWGLKKKSLDMSGALAALVVGFILCLSNSCFAGALVAFFVCASKVTKFRGHMKRKLEEDFKEGGQRNWLQVVCNGGVATEIAIFYLIDVGSKEILINFNTNYNASWFSMAVLGAIACCTGDTFASEIGTVVGSSSVRLITDFSIVPKGTNGGVSPVGVLASILGGLLAGLGFYIPLCLAFGPEQMLDCPSQWPVIVMGGVAGFIGSMVDSVLGATLQYSGYHEDKKCVVETPGPSVTHISGTRVLDNHSVNLVASIITCLIMPYISYHIWWYLDTHAVRS